VKGIEHDAATGRRLLLLELFVLLILLWLFQPELISQSVYAGYAGYPSSIMGLFVLRTQVLPTTSPSAFHRGCQQFRPYHSDEQLDKNVARIMQSHIDPRFDIVKPFARERESSMIYAAPLSQPILRITASFQGVSSQNPTVVMPATEAGLSVHRVVRLGQP
jgi:hypothetical protein